MYRKHAYYSSDLQLDNQLQSTQFTLLFTQVDVRSHVKCVPDVLVWTEIISDTERHCSSPRLWMSVRLNANLKHLTRYITLGLGSCLLS